MKNQELQIPVLGKEIRFPNPEHADAEGLLAVGGDLSPQRLLEGYKNAIFPWFSAAHPILWWSPLERMVIFPEEFHLSRSMRRFLNKKPFQFSIDEAFHDVIDTCATIPRKGEQGTWITRSMRRAYKKLHSLGHAHSIEVRQNKQLAGGVYGVRLNNVFFGESMFSRVSNASKAALWYLCEWAKQENIRMVDCQFHTDHLERLGGTRIKRKEFIENIKNHPEQISETRNETKIHEKANLSF